MLPLRTWPRLESVLVLHGDVGVLPEAGCVVDERWAQVAAPLLPLPVALSPVVAQQEVACTLCNELNITQEKPCLACRGAGQRGCRG